MLILKLLLTGMVPGAHSEIIIDRNGTRCSILKLLLTGMVPGAHSEIIS